MVVWYDWSKICYKKCHLRVRYGVNSLFSIQVQFSVISNLYHSLLPFKFILRNFKYNTIPIHFLKSNLIQIQFVYQFPCSNSLLYRCNINNLCSCYYHVKSQFQTNSQIVYISVWLLIHGFFHIYEVAESLAVGHVWLFSSSDWNCGLLFCS